jgi:hypothetical protein
MPNQKNATGTQPRGVYWLLFFVTLGLKGDGFAHGHA